MNDKEIKLDCLRLALGTMDAPGSPPSGYKSEKVLNVARAYYEFIMINGPAPLKSVA